MNNRVISVEKLTKQYDLGVIGTGTLSRDLNRWWARVRKQPDPHARNGQKDQFEEIGKEVYSIHIYNDVWNTRGISKYGIYARSSLIETLKKNISLGIVCLR